MTWSLIVFSFLLVALFFDIQTIQLWQNCQFLESGFSLFYNFKLLKENVQCMRMYVVRIHKFYCHFCTLCERKISTNFQTMIYDFLNSTENPFNCVYAQYSFCVIVARRILFSRMNSTEIKYYDHILCSCKMVYIFFVYCDLFALYGYRPVLTLFSSCWKTSLNYCHLLCLQPTVYFHSNKIDNNRIHLHVLLFWNQFVNIPRKIRQTRTN